MKSTKPARVVITITREEVTPRQMPGYRDTYKHVYRIVNVQKPHRRLNLAIAEARRRWPNCVIRKAWIAKGAPPA